MNRKTAKRRPEKNGTLARRNPPKRRVKYDTTPGWLRVLKLMLMALVVTLIVEGFNQGSPARMLNYLTQRTLYFVMNWLVVLTTLSLSELIKHRRALAWTISVLWVVLGFANYMVCRNRTQPLVGGDLLITREILGMVTVYFSWPQIIAACVAILAAIFGLILMFSRSRACRRVNYAHAVGYVAALVCFTFCLSLLAIKFDVIPETFGNRVDAYHDYGFTTCFTYTFGTKGISKPDEYSTEVVEEILEEIEEPQATELPLRARFDADDDLARPNIVFIQLESFFDVNTVIDAEFSRDPTPNFHALLSEWPTAELYVPTIGGGTANVEFEVMSGMNMDFFGAGETPYNTIIQEVTCETIANTLRSHGYYSTALHNNTGTFFSRNEDYAQLGYDRFDPLEYMLYPEYNKVGWCHDTVLTDEILRVMENSEQRDLIFAISVESHGKYADTYEYTDGDIEILSLPEDAYLAPFQNYINILPAVDQFIGELLDAFSSYDEPVLVVLYGDHLPALGLTAEMLTTGDLYASRYVIWNNYGAEFEARDMQAYRLSAELLRQLGISDGVMTKFHQSYPLDAEDGEYIEKLKTLEYDLLYGEQEAYGEQGPYAPTELQLGVDPIVITGVELEYGRLLVSGDNFTEYSAVVSGENVLETVFIDKEHLAVRITADERALLGESICVAQVNPDGKELGRTAEFSFDANAKYPHK